MKKRIYLIGAGGHASAFIDLIHSTQNFKIIGILSNKASDIGSFFYNYKVFKEDLILKKLKNKTGIVLAFSSYKNLSLYEKKFKFLKKLGFQIPSIVSPYAYISNSARIGEGVSIFHGCVIGNNVNIGNGVTINSMSLIEHDTKISEFSHISTRCTVNGNVKIGQKVFLGSGSIVNSNLNIESKKFIKMGSLLKK